MSILKNIRRKNLKMDIRKGSSVISNINKLIEMKLLKVDFSTRRFSIFPELFQGKDEVFRNNYCTSISLYWDASTGQTSAKDVFYIYSVESGAQLGTFSRTTGYVEG